MLGCVCRGKTDLFRAAFSAHIAKRRPHCCKQGAQNSKAERLSVWSSPAYMLFVLYFVYCPYGRKDITKQIQKNIEYTIGYFKEN